MMLRRVCIALLLIWSETVSYPLGRAREDCSQAVKLDDKLYGICRLLLKLEAAEINEEYLPGQMSDYLELDSGSDPNDWMKMFEEGPQSSANWIRSKMVAQNPSWTSKRTDTSRFNRFG